MPLEVKHVDSGLMDGERERKWDVETKNSFNYEERTNALLSYIKSEQSFFN